MSKMVKIGIVKAGCIGTLPIIEFLLDERAERLDIDVRVVGSGARLGPEECREVAEKMVEFQPDLALFISPNAGLKGPREGRGILAEAGIPTIVISDGPSKKVVKDLEAAGYGYFIINADAMIGARREFLDPVEMALFNANILKVLSVTGVFNIIVKEIDRVIDALKEGQSSELPRIIIDKEKAAKASGLENPYARAKAMAAYEISRRVADVTTQGCFVVQEMERYIPLVATGHEMMKYAAMLADEAREMEKMTDTLTRTPHHPDGTILWKRRLMEKPSRPEG